MEKGPPQTSDNPPCKVPCQTNTVSAEEVHVLCPTKTASAEEVACPTKTVSAEQIFSAKANDAWTKTSNNHVYKVPLPAIIVTNQTGAFSTAGHYSLARVKVVQLKAADSLVHPTHFNVASSPASTNSTCATGVFSKTVQLTGTQTPLHKAPAQRSGLSPSGVLPTSTSAGGFNLIKVGHYYYLPSGKSMSLSTDFVQANSATKQSLHIPGGAIANVDCAEPTRKRHPSSELSSKRPLASISSARTSILQPNVEQPTKTSPPPKVRQDCLKFRSLLCSSKSLQRPTDEIARESCPEISAGGSTVCETSGQRSKLLSGEPPTGTTINTDVKPVNLVIPISEDSGKTKMLLSLACPIPRNRLPNRPRAAALPAGMLAVSKESHSVKGRCTSMAKTYDENKCWNCKEQFTSSHLLFSDIKGVHLKKRMRVCCAICKEVIKTPTSLQRHYRKHARCAPLGCFYCPKRFRKIGPLEKHTRAHQRCPKAHIQCGWCKRGYPSLQSLKVHIVNMHTDRQYTVCKICGKKVLNIQMHTETHTRQKLRCELCGRKLRDQKSLDKHIRTHAERKKRAELKKLKKSNESSVRLCQICGVTVKNLKSHMTRHVEGKSFSCETCGKMFQTEKKAKYHKKIHMERKNFLCTICGRQYARAALLKRHMERHTGVKRYQCDICELKFFLRSGLTRHMLGHTSAKPFECGFCDKAFADKFYLSKHKLCVHGTAITCFYCSKEFSDMESFKGHVEEHKKFTCHLCGKKFFVDKWLQVHIEKHAGVEAPLSCETCGKTFYIEYNLMKHRLQHK